MLLNIPLKPSINQRITTNVNNQTITLDIYARSTYLFVDFYLEDTLLVAGAHAVNASYIDDYTTNFVGYLFFLDSTQNDPTLNSLGVTTQLFYSDYDALATYYKNL